MRYISIAVAALFAIKILWTLAVPYSLALRKHPERGISLMPGIDVILLAVLVILSCFAGGSLWSWTTSKTLLIGLAIIATAHAHVYVAGILLGGTVWLRSKLRKRTQK
jgi:hypothetical protein